MKDKEYGDLILLTFIPWPAFERVEMILTADEGVTDDTAAAAGYYLNSMFDLIFLFFLLLAQVRGFRMDRYLTFPGLRDLRLA